MSREDRRKHRKRHHVRQHHAARPRRCVRGWLSFGRLAASTGLIGGLATPLYAMGLSSVLIPVPSETAWAFQSGAGAPAAPAAPGTPGAATEPIRTFDLAAGPISNLIPMFERVTGLHVVLAMDSIGMIQSPGVSGSLTVSQALERLLSGTDVAFRFTSPNVVTLDLGQFSDAVNVVAAPVPVAVSPKYAAPLLDTPQSIDVLPRQVLADQGVLTLRDAVRNIAGISIAAGEGSSQGDNLTIRGFTARSDIFIDGMRDFGSYYRDPFNQEQIQVLKGPSSVTFGRGSTGGVLNQSSKIPELRPSFGGAVNFGTDETRRVTMDVNQPVPELGDGAAFRLNVMAHAAHVAGRDIAENRRFGIAPSLSLGIGTPTRTTLSYFHQSNNDTPDYGIPWLFNGPAPVSRNNYYGFQENNFLRTNADIGTVKVEHDFSGTLRLSSQARYANYGRDVQITEPRVAGTPTVSTPLSAITVTRNELAASSTESLLQDQTDLTAHIRTGTFQHTLVAGVEASRETSDPTRFTFTGVPTTSLLTPDESQPFAGTAAVSSKTDATAVSVGGYALDTVALGGRWELMGGVRWDRFAASVAQSVAPATSFSRVDRMTSWRGAVVYKPAPNGSVYFDYGTSFNPSAESLTLSATTANTPPERNETFEVGSKWDLSQGRLSVRGAIFRTDKTNAREPDPNNALLTVLSGEQRVNGFELEATGHVNERWQTLASYAFMDGKLVSSVAFPAAVGAQLANAPHHTLSLWSSYEFPGRLELGGGVRYVSERTASTTVPLDPTTGLVKALPGYWTSSAMVKRRLTPRVDAQVNVENLANAYDFDQLHPGHIVPGPGRSALLGINFKF